MRSKTATVARRAAVLVVACWLFQAGSAFGAVATVDVGNFLKFDPANTTVDQGDTVTWRWIGPDTNHDVFSAPGQPELFESHPGPASQVTGPPPGGTFSHVFPTVGRFSYACRVHPSMQGAVVVRRVDSPVAGAQPVGQLSPACVSKRNFKIRIRQPRGTRLTAASVTVNGKPVAVSAMQGRFTAPVDLRGLPKGSYEVTITARTSKGTTLRGKRLYRTCDAKLASSALPQL